MALEGVTTTAGSCTFPHPFNFKIATWHVSAVHSAAAGDEMHEGPPSLYPLSDADARAANNVMHEVVPVVQRERLSAERERERANARGLKLRIPKWLGTGEELHLPLSERLVHGAEP